ncbi:MAG: ParB N-terminal domain-containing protein [Trueperella sp.]|uniref:ParB N-terminal domain-containing protein n=1 Tax=Trueperella sp. TaxID=2699835 RepID=UPI002A914DF5|nr:ParB N-terminal domain-containing protein [Trueperella sp.]MDY5404424.1 ParB N-terminal domain-containing protein [Trueperella sp.]
MTTYQIHPYADKYPMLPDDELAELAESIRANGLRQPIVLDTEGRILDGRNRLAACEKAGVAPSFTTYEGEDLAEYVIDCNTSRRHMTTGARAMATALILMEDRGREAGRWNGRAAISDVGNSKGWKQRISECGVVLDYAPHLAEKVRNDELPLNTAFEQAKAVKANAEAEKIAERNRRRAQAEAEKAEAERQQRLLNELTQAAATQFLAYIDRGEMDIPTAHAAWLEATRKEREEARQMDHSRLVTMRGINSGLRTFAGGADYATVIWTEAYPHEKRLMDERDHLTVDRIQTAIDYLQRLKEHLTNDNRP